MWLGKEVWKFGGPEHFIWRRGNCLARITITALDAQRSLWVQRAKTHRRHWAEASPGRYASYLAPGRPMCFIRLMLTGKGLVLWKTLPVFLLIPRRHWS